MVIFVFLQQVRMEFQWLLQATKVPMLDNEASYDVLSNRTTSDMVTDTTNEANNKEPPIPLHKLAQSSQAAQMRCPEPLRLIQDVIVSDEQTASRKIPRILHMTAASRCNHPIFADNLRMTWRSVLTNYSFYFHDDQAVHDLLYGREWPEFPQLSFLLDACILPGYHQYRQDSYMGAIMIDVWRLLVLWEYGGIYADLDTAPNLDNFHETTITNDMDALFVMDRLGSPSQWFMAVSPKHPLIYNSIVFLMRNMITFRGGEFRVVFMTGPGVIAQGFHAFHHFAKTQYEVEAGTYYHDYGTTLDSDNNNNPQDLNRSVTILGDRHKENEYIVRVIPSVLNENTKDEIYQTTNMTHLTKMNHYRNQSCLEALYQRVVLGVGSSSR